MTASELVSRIWLLLTTLQLHITHGLQLPSFTALRHTHSHPPLHQSHSCHQSLINPDCFTTPAPHSHTHTYKQHTSLHSPQSLVLPWLTFLSVSPVFCFPGLPVHSDCLLPAFRYPLCLPPAPTFALPLLLILPCLRDTCYCLWPLPVWPCLVVH